MATMKLMFFARERAGCELICTVFDSYIDVPAGLPMGLPRDSRLSPRLRVGLGGRNQRELV